MIEKDFVTEGLKRTRIDEYLENELERAGYGGMEIQVTPLGTMVVVYAERPGMVIGRGGKTVRNITQQLKNNYDLENPQVEVKEVDVPELNPKIMAHKIAAMLQRGMHFRRVAYTALRRIMGAGAQGVEVTISGKIRGSRSACAKFIDGYIKKCGEPATRFVREGFATVQLKPGVLGIYVRIMPPGTVLPDKVDIIQPAVEETPLETVVEEKTSAPVEGEKAEEPGEESISDVLEEETAEEIEDIEEIEEEAASEKPAEEEAAEKESVKESKEEPAEEKPAKPEKEAATKKPAEEPAEEPAKKEPKKEKPKRGRPKKEEPKAEKPEEEPEEEKPKKRGRPKKEPAAEEPKKTFKTAELVKPAGDKK
ncbi:MAG: 30S ribosomal protein S3 [Methanobacteriaceae archaeon]|jgi:small subunit ribosomal protein S3|nr:30S ribosomal protein S3 [Methanobacteriaceae archaeon]